jgi:hypothetical protein
MANFLQDFAGLGQAFGGIATGLDQGMAPLKTWEGIRTSDLANDKSEIANQDLQQQQFARMGTLDPAQQQGYYGAWQNNQISGLQNVTASNQLGTQTQQQQIDMYRLATSPEGRARLQGLDPSSPQFAMELEKMRAETNPFSVPDDITKTLIPAQQRGANQQATQNFLQTAMMSMKDPNTGEAMFGEGDTIVPSPGGGYVMKKANGDVVAVPYNLAAFAQQMENNPTLFKALQDRANASNTQRTSDITAQDQILKLGQTLMANDPLVAAGTKEMADSPERQQAIATLDAQETAARALQAHGQQLISSRVRGQGYTQSAAATGQTGGGAGGLMLNYAKNGQPIFTGNQPTNTNSFGQVPLGGPYAQPGQGPTNVPMTSYPVNPADVYSSNVPDQTMFTGGQNFVGPPYVGGATPQNQTVITAVPSAAPSAPYNNANFPVDPNAIPLGRWITQPGTVATPNAGARSRYLANRRGP